VLGKKLLHPAFDAVVIGVPDERWALRVAQGE
jgi:hypothetical protein